MFKSFKTKVESLLGKGIKSIIFDCGGKSYGKYNGSGEQHPGPFAKFLEECGIILQYNILSSPSMNGVIERRNKMFKDTVRSMIRCY